MAAPIFRESAMARLNSPEQLNDAIRITSSTSWLAGLGLLTVIAAALAWSIFGTVPTRVGGSGIIVYRNAETHEVVAEGPGLLEEVLVEPAERVSKDQVIAVITNPQLELQIAAARDDLAGFEAERAAMAAQRDEQLVDLRRYVDQRTQELHTRIAESRERARSLSVSLSEDKELLARGLNTRRAVEETQAKLFAAEQDVRAATSELTQLSLTEQEKKDRWAERVLQVEHRVSRQRRKLAQLEVELLASDIIVSPSDGVVEQVTGISGSYLAAGGSIAIITDTSKELAVKLFVAAADAKLIEPGMKAQVSPGTVKKEEHGTIVGAVRTVSDFPLSAPAMMALLENQDLVDSFSKQGPPYMVDVFMREPGGPGKLEWSSGNPPPFEITAGTLTSATITVREQPPLTMVIPALRKIFGLP